MQLCLKLNKQYELPQQENASVSEKYIKTEVFDYNGQSVAPGLGTSFVSTFRERSTKKHGSLDMYLNLMSIKAIPNQLSLSSSLSLSLALSLGHFTMTFVNKKREQQG